VVIVNTSRWRCDALVVAADGVTVVPLPRLTREQVRTRALRFLEAVRSVRPSMGRAADPDRMEAVIAREETMTETLAWLWDTVAEPVLTALGHRETPAPGARWPHLWWCPTSLLLDDTALRIADLAAGDYGGGQFAFLSACETVVGGVDVADESITLAAALHQAVRAMRDAAPHTPSSWAAFLHVGG
jgi:hypothetical protein